MLPRPRVSTPHCLGEHHYNFDLPSTSLQYDLQKDSTDVNIFFPLHKRYRYYSKHIDGFIITSRACWDFGIWFMGWRDWILALGRGFWPAFRSLRRPDDRPPRPLTQQGMPWAWHEPQMACQTQTPGRPDQATVGLFSACSAK